VTEEHSASVFDRFAERATSLVSGAVFFILCVALVVVWAPSYFLLQSLNTWQLIINTITTIITFLLVALLQNSQQRVEKAMNEKLDALADGLADLLEDRGKRDDVRELRDAVGIENTGSS
jgi:low affinity Fe/Cu permease